MSELRWRQGHGIDSFREWGRRCLPRPGAGMVITDLDIGIRRYGNNFGLDQEGDLMLIEKKEYVGVVGNGQRRVYDWVSKYIEHPLWRGWHILKVDYATDAVLCEKCHQPIETADQSFERFLGAKLTFDGKQVSSEDLAKIIKGD